MIRRILAALAVLAVVAGRSVGAHHSFAATYFEGRDVTIEGTLVQFMFRNPHSFVQLKGVAKDDRSRTERVYTIEWGGGGQLSRSGITQNTLKPGDRVIISGSPARNPTSFRVRMKSILRPKDGWKWSGVVE